MKPPYSRPPAAISSRSPGLHPWLGVSHRYRSTRIGFLPRRQAQKNVIVLVFDAWSAHDVPLYGYQRDTVPNVVRFAENATVYHNHYTAGTFTVPGTASLLTGLLPWSHRAFQLGAGGVSRRASRPPAVCGTARHPQHARLRTQQLCRSAGQPGRARCGHAFRCQQLQH